MSTLRSVDHAAPEPSYTEQVCEVVFFLLLQLCDRLLLEVKLVPQIADLLLMDFTVGLDLLLHRFLVKHADTNSGTYSFQGGGGGVYVRGTVACCYLDFIGRLDLILQPVDFIWKESKDTRSSSFSLIQDVAFLPNTLELKTKGLGNRACELRNG